MVARQKQPLCGFVAVILLALTAQSCEQKLVAREYEEIVTEVKSQKPTDSHNDPHELMRDSSLPPDHPDISMSNTMPDLPPGHPDISMGDTMALPADHPDISMPMDMAAAAGDPQLQKMLDASVARPPLSWSVPDGWVEEQGGGMRLVTFRSNDQGKPIECSVVSLGGAAGGLQSNVVRWMGQINVAASSDDQINAFLSRQKVIQTKGDFQITVVDLTEFVHGDQAPSMLAAIAELADMRIFVKMTGTQAAVTGNRDQFISLIRSLAL